MAFTRREFIVASTAGVAASLPMATARDARAQPLPLETFSDWLRADRETRKRGLEQCLQRIRELEPTIHAWAHVEPGQSAGEGPLAGIPFGVKDIVETKGMATEYGSLLYKGRLGTADAAIVRQLRERGALLLGKTVTTAFAYRTPGPTRNPRNPNHTPGGSSSGSAAAVAAGMVPFTVGEQTRGSMIRPASFCGITGFKPTYGVLPMEGVFVLAKSLDTLGFYTHTPADMIALWAAIGKSTGSDEEFPFAVPEPMLDCDPEMATTFQQTITSLRRGGVTIRTIDCADLLRKLDEANSVEMMYEGARRHQARLKEFGDALDQPLADLIREGLKISTARYSDATKFIADSRGRFAEIFTSTPVVLTPAAPGPAPVGLSTTGDPRMNAPWTALGTPAVSIPMPVASGLPLGLQLTADLGQDARLLRAARLVDQRMRKTS